MLDCYTLSLLSLSLILSIIIINIFIINVILEKKEKRTRWEGGFTNKTVWACLYAYYLCTNFFLLACFLVVSCKKFLCFFRLYNCVCKFDKTKDKNLLKENNITREIFFFSKSCRKWRRVPSSRPLFVFKKSFIWGKSKWSAASF